MPKEEEEARSCLTSEFWAVTRLIGLPHAIAEQASRREKDSSSCFNKRISLICKPLALYWISYIWQQIVCTLLIALPLCDGRPVRGLLSSPA